MYESSASKDGWGTNVSGNNDVEITRTALGKRYLNSPGPWSDKRRHIIPHRAQWAVLLLTVVVCLVLLSACDVNPTSASGAHSPTATAGLSGTLAAAATAQAAASANDHLSTVFIAESTGSESSVLALNPTDGSVLWRSKTFVGTMGVGLLQQSQGVVLVSTSDTTVVALDARDGMERWHIDLTAGPTNDSVFDGNAFYVDRNVGPGLRATVFAYRITDGTQLWHYDTLGDCGPRHMTAAAGIVVLSTVGCGATAQVTALSERDGTVLWKSPTNDISCEVAIANGVVYTDGTGIVAALDAATGTRKWHYTPPQGSAMGGSSISFGDQMVIAEAGKTLLALRPQDGSMAWSVDFPGFLSGHVIAGNVVYVTADGTGAVTALRLNDGTRLWRTPLDLPNPLAPVAANSVLFVSAYKPAVPPNGTETDKVYAIQLTDGTVAWQHTTKGS